MVPGQASDTQPEIGASGVAAINPFNHVAGPLRVAVCSFGPDRGGVVFDGMVVFAGATGDPLPHDVREAVLGHVRRGERIVVMAYSMAQLEWAQRSISALQMPEGRA